MIVVEKTMGNSTLFIPRQEHVDVSGETTLKIYSDVTKETVIHDVTDVSGLSDYFVTDIYLQYLPDGFYQYTLEGVGSGLMYKGDVYSEKREKKNTQYNNSVTYKEYDP